MTPLISVLILCLVTGILCSVLWTPRRNNRRLPPGPRALPVIGNLHVLGSLPHRSLQTLARKYGPIMTVDLGLVPTVVISSPTAAEQVLKAHDTAFAGRPRTQATDSLSYGGKGVVFAEYGPRWRFMRKTCTLKLLSASRIESFAPLRRREVGSMVERLRSSAAEERDDDVVVNLSEEVSRVVEEMTFRTVCGSEIDSVDFKALAKEGLRLAGSFNLSDYVPFLGVLDLQGLKRQIVKLSKDIDKIIDQIIDDVQQICVDTKQDGKNEKPMSFIEVLLSLMNQSMINHHESRDQQDYIHITNVKAVLVEMIGAAFDTTVGAIEWTLSELLRHPMVMARVQQELHDVVGTKKMVEEVDLQKLTYFEMVIMESLRLHPIVPFLVPHESIENVELCGYFIPKKTRVLINTWAIGRDPNIWSDNVEQFIPERFVDSEMGFKGNDFRFLPFGHGRRGCLGMQLGLTTVRFVVAQLVHCFNWKLPNEMLPSELDMTEKFGLTLPRANPLLAVPKYRLT